MLVFPALTHSLTASFVVSLLLTPVAAIEDAGTASMATAMPVRMSLRICGGLSLGLPTLLAARQQRHQWRRVVTRAAENCGELRCGLRATTETVHARAARPVAGVGRARRWSAGSPRRRHRRSWRHDAGPGARSWRTTATPYWCLYGCTFHQIGNSTRPRTSSSRTRRRGRGLASVRPRRPPRRLVGRSMGRRRRRREVSPPEREVPPAPLEATGGRGVAWGVATQRTAIVGTGEPAKSRPPA